MSSIESSPAFAPTAGTPPKNRHVLKVVGAMILVLGALYWESIWSMVSIWARSETFMHGFLIIPLSAYLIYVRRDSLRGVQLEPYLPGLIPLSLFCLIWFAGWSARADVVEQFAVIAMTIAMLLVLLGYRMVIKIAGPLAYLFFAVPFGEILIAPLREFTTISIIAGLNLVGISVVRSGFYLSTSVGDFAVERACSGLRYLIASFALGTLFAQLYMTSTRRRTIFIVLSLVVPVLANGLRAFIIVVLAHLSSLKIAAGVDHLIYGWIFFGIVMLLLFWLGARMEDRSTAPPGTAVPASPSERGVPRGKFIAAGFLIAVVLSIAPLTARVVESREEGQKAPLAYLPDLGAGWKRLPLDDLSWVPDFKGHVDVLKGSYQQAGSSAVAVDVAVASYGEEDSEGGLIGFGNRASNGEVWRESSRTTRVVESTPGVRLPFAVVVLQSPVTRRHRVIWYCYLIDSVPVANDYWGKAAQAWTRIVSPGRPLWSFAFSADSADPEMDLNATVEAFVHDHFAQFTTHSVERNPELNSIASELGVDQRSNK